MSLTLDSDLPRLPPQLEAAARSAVEAGSPIVRGPDLRIFLRRVLKAIGVRLAASWEDVSELFRASTEDHLANSAEDLARWTGLLAAGALSQKDFSWLVRSQADLASFRALNLAGLSRTQIDAVRSMLVEAIVATAFATLLGVGEPKH